MYKVLEIRNVHYYLIASIINNSAYVFMNMSNYDRSLISKHYNFKGRLRLPKIPLLISQVTLEIEF